MTPFDTWSLFAMIAVIINTILFSKKPPKKSIVGVLFGIHLSLMGVFVLFFVNTALQYTGSHLLIPTFVAIFMVVTGLAMGLYEYLA